MPTDHTLGMEVVAMRVLVTGGAGFIGSRLVARLIAMGHLVTVLDDFSSVRRPLPPDARIIEGDVRDEAAVRLSLHRQEAVFQLAAVVGVPNAMRRQWDSLTTNVLGTMRLLEALPSGVPLILGSSSAIYGKTPQVPVREGDDVLLGNTHIASWTYSYAKLTEELLARASAAERGSEVKIVRLFNVVGPGQTGRYGMVLPRLVGQALAGEPLTVYGDGSQTRTFVDVRDAVAGILTVWDKGAPGDAYNVGGVGEVRILDLARRVIALTGSRSPIHLVPMAAVFGPAFEETPRRAPSIEKVRALGYQPLISLDETIQDIAAWLAQAPSPEP